MPYASLEDLTERAGAAEIKQIADRDRDGEPDPEVIEAAIAHATNVIDGYVAARYALPLEPVPDLVRTWSTSIARYFLHRNKPPEYVIQDYKDAIAALKDVAGGRLVLPATAGQAPEQTAGRFLVANPPAVFDADKLRGW